MALDPNLSLLLPAGIIAFVAAFLLLVIVIMIILYLYSALALMAIAKKTKTQPAWLAFVPILNYYLTSKIAKMPWWPILLLVGFWIPFIGMIAIAVFTVFTIIWNYKMFEAVKKPGWWALFMIIPIFGTIIYLILLGVAAWGKK